MLDSNADKILGRLRPDDVVLDIGGWARPFNRADHVIDQEPWETRGYYGAQLPAQGGVEERFRRETWIQRDICSREPFPFGDDEIDFVICSHTLEDIRDPLWVCSEMVRVAKAGYVEVPSRLAETCRGIEYGQVGWSHHRWLVEIRERHVEFLMKYHAIHSRRSLSFPRRFLRELGEERQVTWLFWQGSFTYGEKTLHGVDKMVDELRSFVEKHRPYSPAYLRTEAAWHRLRWLAGRIPERARSLLAR